MELTPPGPRGIPPLFARLVDDSALFPPGDATMPEALKGHFETRAGEHAGVLGVFLCQASRLPELITELIKIRPKEPLPLSLIIDTGLGGVPKAISIVESRNELLALRMVEMPAPSDVDEVWLERVSEFVPEDVVRVVEPRRGVGWLDGVRKVIEHGSWPKIRCGGLSRENFPSVDEVADFLSVVSSFSGAAFKATNSLHRAVRHVDADSGFEHHGFLNLLVASARCLSGGNVRDALASTDGEALASEAAELSDEAAKAVRAVFASYASATFDEPIADLKGLGLL
ncbi:hypothetical protein DI005_16725 [Prauserella sp. PE36]|uniref:Uncharacterized protein n=1 Tax=Prauserella endophytica TaxID=1592324 RepID=A0ABY2SCV5_9PSEU|nr:MULTISPECIES: hypothetical protein [Prauserella]RBM19323.1 hypothetical protein DI005_16725 [Prauserella sp. PE36]TKG73775.1 hypothetical protein FCN18_02330 [Prauserella endophytica]